MNSNNGIAGQFQQHIYIPTPQILIGGKWNEEVKYVTQRYEPQSTWFDKLLAFFDHKAYKGNFVWKGNKVVFKRCKNGKFTCTKSGNTTNITIN
jgi:hypothetical protein